MTWFSPDFDAAELAAACDPTPPRPHAALIAATQALIRTTRTAAADASHADRHDLLQFADLVTEAMRECLQHIGERDSYSPPRLFDACL